MKASQLLISIANVETDHLVLMAKNKINNAEEELETQFLEPVLIGQDFGYNGGIITETVKSYVEEANKIIDGFSERFYDGFRRGSEFYHSDEMYSPFE